MAHFEYSAQSKSGAAMSGTFEVADNAVAMEQLASMGLKNIELRAAKQAPMRRVLSRDDFIFFNEQLASLANAGICLDEGLRQLGRDVHSRRLQGVLQMIANEIEQGQSLPDAIEKHAPQVPALYAQVVRAGVANGQLSATLLNLSHHLRLVSETRRLLGEALMYPAIVLALALGVFCAVLLFVVPQFAETFAGFGVRLPWITTTMISLSHALPQLLVFAGIAVVALASSFLVLHRSMAGRLMCDRIVLRIPLLGAMIRNSLRARFLRAMAFAVDSGVPLPEAIRLSAGATGSLALSHEAWSVALAIENGADVGEACRGTRLVPAMFSYFVGGSPDLGILRDGLIQLSKAYESQAIHSQLLLRGWVAPAAIFGVGAVIGLLILALFLPLVQMVQSVSG
ncbi:MAG: type II secretion system F family protein [Planctomycetes bacterium]|nr:type II secretion system F family protein [Planctomycetota bacterium]MBI3835730.1 type II secretion system F family protein [Planctomycetota bacterium]